MGAKPVRAYELGRRRGSDRWTIARVYKANDGAPDSSGYEEFQLGEPVYHRFSFVHKDSEGDWVPEPGDKIWWIGEFEEDENEGFVGLSDCRDGSVCEWAPIPMLEKLPEMVRLAVEYSQ